MQRTIRARPGCQQAHSQQCQVLAGSYTNDRSESGTRRSAGGMATVRPGSKFAVCIRSPLASRRIGRMRRFAARNGRSTSHPIGRSTSRFASEAAVQFATPHIPSFTFAVATSKMIAAMIAIFELCLRKATAKIVESLSVQLAATKRHRTAQRCVRVHDRAFALLMSFWVEMSTDVVQNIGGGRRSRSVRASQKRNASWNARRQ